MSGPELDVCDLEHENKYRSVGENHREAMNRIASSLKDDDNHFKHVKEILQEMRYLPPGRVQAGAGSAYNVTMQNCIVSGPIEDSFIEGSGSIMSRATEAAHTMRMGAGIGYDFSTLRPRGALIKKLNSSSSGPLSFMDIFNSICKTIQSAGHRRGAQMAVLRVDHPDIVDYIHAKQNDWNLTKFNTSIAITDEFMECLEAEKPFKLRFGGTVYSEIDPHNLWEMIMRSTWDWGEPGVLFIDTINKMNNLHYCETIAATNPCFKGDQKIWTSEGPKTFKELEGKKVSVLTENKSGKLVYRDMNVFMTAKNQKIIRVTLDDGTEIDCTPNHEFFDIDRNRVEAKDLAVGQRIASVYRHNANSKGYKRLTNGIDNPLEHHVAFEVIPDGFCVHHKNEIKDDNRPVNLESMRIKDHNSHHMIGNRNPSRTHPENNWLIQKDHGGENNGRYRHDIEDEILEEMRKSGMSYKAIADKIGCSKYTVMKRLGYSRPNHIVVSVETLDKTEDVFCGTVDETHKFFIVCNRGGVLVSNCGEQPLPPFGACLLGSFNLTKYVFRYSDRTPFFDFDLLRSDIPAIVRMMDNVVDKSNYPLYEQEKEAKMKRRMGQGVTGLANTIEALIGNSYGSDNFIELQAEILQCINETAYRSSIELAREKGSFIALNKEEYLKGEFIKQLPDDIRDGIKKYGIRNSHLTSIAPTGTISFCADNISSGIEPVFSYFTDRNIETFDGKKTVKAIEDYGHRVFGTKGKQCKDVTADEHVKVLTTAQKYVDSAVSKTCNVSPEMPWEEFKDIYLKAYHGGAKGCTTFNPAGKRFAMMTASNGEGEACYIDEETGRRECQ